MTDSEITDRETIDRATIDRESSPDPARRSFFEKITYLLGGLASFLLGLPLGRYFLGVRSPQAQWVLLGELQSFPVNETRLATFKNPLAQPWDGHTADTGVFVRCLENSDPMQPQFQVLLMNCAHLGCPVTWFAESGLFMCPCHGGVYYANGERASGPPPRGLFHCRWRVDKGQLFVEAPHFPTLYDTEIRPAKGFAQRCDAGARPHV
ncbi:ubiquinol-cytochrome c reductase iron-sulfur subunit [Planctomicrobium sp. SH664]|uniref:QcrA and Rieske domain-containing protein n=1 Tax=Planctomicrobium sp. SH664 TaxID=3448125 RepID=UPI003F5C1C12